jgi:hypothetical protein
MSLTYNGTLTTDLDRVRFYLGDMVTNSGPKPADANFTDAELTGLISLEGSWDRAVAAGFETLAALWSKHVTFSADGMSASQSDVAKQFADSAAKWRLRTGSAPGTSCGSSPSTRADGYSDDLDNVTP